MGVPDTGPVTPGSTRAVTPGLDPGSCFFLNAILRKERVREGRPRTAKPPPHIISIPMPNVRFGWKTDIAVDRTRTRLGSEKPGPHSSSN